MLRSDVGGAMSSIIPNGLEPEAAAEMERLHVLHEARVKANSETSRVMGEKSEQRSDLRREYLTRRHQHLRKLYVARQQRIVASQLQQSPFADSVSIPSGTSGPSGHNPSRPPAKGSGRGTSGSLSPERARSVAEGAAAGGFRNVLVSSDESGAAASINVNSLATLDSNKKSKKAQHILQEQRRIAIERRQKQLQDIIRGSSAPSDHKEM